MPDNINLAALWIPVMPETSHMGEAMEEAGKAAQEGFAKGAKDIGKPVSESLEAVSKDAREQFERASKHVKDVFASVSKNGKTDVQSAAKDMGEAVDKAAKDMRSSLEKSLNIKDLRTQFAGQIHAAIKDDIPRSGLRAEKLIDADKFKARMKEVSQSASATVSKDIENALGDGAEKSKGAFRQMSTAVGGFVKDQLKDAGKQWIAGLSKDLESGGLGKVANTLRTQAESFTDITGIGTGGIQGPLHQVEGLFDYESPEDARDRKAEERKIEQTKRQQAREQAADRREQERDQKRAQREQEREQKREQREQERAQRRGSGRTRSSFVGPQPNSFVDTGVNLDQPRSAMASAVSGLATSGGDLHATSESLAAISDSLGTISTVDTSSVTGFFDKASQVTEVAGNLKDSFSGAFQAEGLHGASDSLARIANSFNDIGGAKLSGVSEFFDKASTVTAFAGSIKDGVEAFKALATVTKAAIAPQVALNVAEDANPLGAIVLAIEAAVAAFAALAAGVKYAYDHWQPFHDFVDKAWDLLKKLGSTLKDVVVAGFNLASDAVKAWGRGIKAEFDMFKNAWNEVNDHVLKPLGNAFKTAFDAVKHVVGEAVEWITGKFDSLMNAIKHPLDAVGSVLSHIPGAGTVMNLFGHAEGGPIDGPGATGKDSVLMMGAPGEHVWTSDEVQRAGGHQMLYALRALAKAGRLRVPGFEGGGPIGDTGGMNAAQDWARSQVGVPYSQDLRNDCSGMVSQIVNVATGSAPRSSLMTTQNEEEWLRSKGFIMGDGPAGTLRVGWYNHGSGANDGHTALTFPDGTNAESGGKHGNFLMGAGAAGASSSMFDQHAYLPMNPQGPGSGGDGGSGALGGSSSGSSGSGGGGSSGGSGGSGGGSGQSDEDFGKSLGKNMAGGMMEELGLDGSVFKGGSPLDFGVTKMFTGLLDSLGGGKSAGAASRTSGIGYGASDPAMLTAPILPDMKGHPAEDPMATRAPLTGTSVGTQINVGGNYQPNQFNANGVGNVQDMQHQSNANNARATPVVHNAGGKPR